MTTLYIAPGSCSFASHIVVQELKLNVQVEKVPLRHPDSLINRVSPFGKVPALVTDQGTLITENTALLPVLADLDSTQRLIAKAGSDERAQIQSWLGFLSSEIHAGSFRIVNRAAEFTPDEDAQKSIRQYGSKKLKDNFKVIEKHLANKTFLVGERLTVADIYLGIFLNWYARIDAEFKDLPNLQRAYQLFLALPSVQAAQDAEAALSLGATA